jgi:hypothetical protein
MRVEDLALEHRYEVDDAVCGMAISIWSSMKISI